jgi:hypothetical protein
MSTCRYRGGAVLLIAPLVLAACNMGENPSASTGPGAGDTVASAVPSPASQVGKLGVPVRNGSFEVTVTKVETGVRQLDITDVAKASGHKPWRPVNGQYVVVHLSAKNVGSTPMLCSTSNSLLVDDDDRSYGSTALLGGASPVGQGLGADLQPGTSGSGFIVFDVPASAGTPATLVLKTRVYATGAEAPTVVNLRG